MPLVRIDLLAGKPEKYRHTVGDVVAQALYGIGVPDADRFQIITEHPPEGMIIDRGYLGIERTDDIVVIQITLNEGRAVDLKRVLYRSIADGLQTRVGMRPQDVFINLVEVKKENWSFGNGDAQYAE
jgi:4-oxalocrotonate tautomerase